MTRIEESIVRNYFESNGFLVRRLHRERSSSRARKQEPDYRDFAVTNMAPPMDNREPGFQLFSNDLPLIRKAVVFVRTPVGRLNSINSLSGSNEMARFIEKELTRSPDETFAISDELVTRAGPHTFFRILVIPGLPSKDPHRLEAMRRLQTIEIDAVISIRSMLQDLSVRMERQSPNNDSDLMETLRLLKTFDMLKSPQMEIDFPTKR